MKPIVPNNIVIAQVGETAEFSISLTGKAFQLLSDPYSNKPRAVVRETIANAIDSHDTNGMSHVPVDVTLPTKLSPTFIIRDHGPGMNHKTAMTVYTTYFESTKEANNNAIGGLGLGCKSPFSLTDMFNVKSWCDGVVTTYSCYKEAGVPKISVLNSEHYEDASLHGVEVSINIPHNHIDAIRINAQSIYSLFPVKPVVSNTDFSYPASNIAYDGTHFQILTQNESSVLMGNIVYPLSIQNVKNDITGYRRAILNQSCIRIKLDIGSVEVPPSREELSYDDRSIQNVLTKLDQVHEELVAIAREQVAKSANLFNFWADMQKLRVGSMWNATPIQRITRCVWEVMKDSPAVIEFEDSGINVLTFNAYSLLYIYAKSKCPVGWTRGSSIKILRKGQRGEPKRSMEDVWNCGRDTVVIGEGDLSLCQIVVNDKPTRALATLKYILTTKTKERQILVFQVTPESLSDVEGLLASMGNPSVIYTSQVELPPGEKPVRDCDTFAARSFYRGDLHRVERVSKAEGGVYAVRSHDIQFRGNSISSSVLETMMTANIAPEHIVTVSEPQAKMLSKLPQWTTLEAYTAPRCDVFAATHSAQLSVMSHIADTQSSVNQLIYGPIYSKLVREMPVDNILVQYLNIIRNYMLTYTSFGKLQNTPDLIFEHRRQWTPGSGTSVMDDQTYYIKYMYEESLEGAPHRGSIWIKDHIRTRCTGNKALHKICTGYDCGELRKIIMGSQTVTASPLDNMVTSIEKMYPMLKMVGLESSLLSNNESIDTLVDYLKGQK